MTVRAVETNAWRAGEVACSGRQPVYVVSDDEREFARDFLSHKGSGPFVAVQLQAADRYRDYPHLETVVKSLAQHCDVLVFAFA